MSNAIDLVVSKQAQQGLDELISKLYQANDALIQNSQAALNFNKNISTIKTPGDLNKHAAGNSAYVANVEKEIAASKRLQKQIETQRLAEIKLAQQREKAVDNYTKAELKASQALARSESVYGKIQAKVNSLTTTYNNLAAKRELGIKLSTRETAQLDSLTNRLNKYQTALINVDKGIQKHGRVVGNYATGYNGLSASIGQISRELPNFGQSIQIGILSLTNNIGALQDAIAQVKIQNAALQAEGKATRSVMSQIGASILSFNTALYIGIALFSAYGKEIGDWAENLFKGKDALDVIKESTNTLNDVRLKSLKGITQERIELDLNIKTARNKALSDKEREIAAQKVLDQYPFWFENLDKEAIMNGNVEKAVRGVNAALLARAQSAAAVDKITENYSKIIDLQEELRLERKLEEQRDKAAAKVAKQAADIVTTSTRETTDLYQTGRVQAATDRLNESRRKIIETQKAINDLTAINARLLGYTTAEYEKSIGLDYSSVNAKTAKTKATKDNTEAEEENTQTITNSINAFETQIAALRKTRDAVEAGSETYYFLDGTIKLLEESLKSIKGEIEDVKEVTEDGIIISDEDLYAEFYRYEKLKAKTKELIKSVGDSYLSSVGLGAFQQFFDGSFFEQIDNLGKSAEDMRMKFQLAFQGITEAAQQAFAFMNQSDEQYFRNAFDRLEAQKEISIRFAGDSVTAREEVERQYEERRKVIQRQQAESEKKNAMFKAIINTAQAIVAALPNIALSVAVGLVGAAQIAMISNQQIPAFAEGGVHEGGLMKVNDAKGSNYRETIVTPGGKVLKPTGRNVIMNAPKGTQIFTPEQWESNLNAFLAGQGIMTASSAAAANQLSQQSGFDYNRMESAFSSAVKGLPKGDKVEIVRDARGYQAYKVSQNARVKLLNSRVRIQGRDV